MIPIKLIIQGLYSYQEKQTIDFTQLTSAHLFGIFGAVGSGKSTILEAITFALYGKTDRLNLSGDNRNYNMMNLKSSDLLIDFEFETGKDQTAYRATVKGKRNSKRFEEVKALERSAYQLVNGSWIPIEAEQLERAIGLSYDNFKRTIIIPQGQFQEFLQLGNKDRTQMMKELFGLEKFELYYKVVSLESKNNAQKQNLEGQLQQLGAVDPGQLIVFQAKMNELKTEIGQLNLKITESQKLETELKQLSERFAKKEETVKKLEQLTLQLPYIESLEKKIADFEYCLIRFKPLFDQINGSTQKIQSLEKKIGEESLSLKQAEEQLKTADELFGKIKTEYDDREKLRQKAEELDKLIRLAELRQLTEQAQIRLKKGEEVIQKTISTIDQLKKEKEALEIRLKSEKEAQPDMLVLSNARSWHEIQASLAQQFVANTSEREKYSTEITLSKKNISELFDAAVFTGFSGERNFTEGTSFLKNKIALLKTQLTGVDAQIQHFSVQLKLEEFAVGLQEGEACPVCGSLHHPHVLVAADVAENLKLAKNKKKALEIEIQNCDQLGLRLAELNNLLLLNEKQLAGIQEKRKELDTKKTVHEQLFQWDKYRTIDAVNEAFRLAESLKKNIDRSEKQRDETSKKLDQEIQNKEKFQREIDRINAEVIASKAETGTLTAQINWVDATSYSQKLKPEIEAEKKALFQQYADLEKQFNQLNNQLQELRKGKDVLNGSIAANQTQLNLEKSLAEKLKQELENELNSSDFKGLETVALVLKQELNIPEAKQKITAFRQEISFARNQLEQLTDEIGERKYDLETHRLLQEQLSKYHLLINQLNRELGITEKSLSDLQKALQTHAQLRKELEQLELRAENIKTLKKLFTASGFVNYISSVYLQNLCNAANERFFQLTRQKLSLEITTDNNFQVRDYLNGGKVRSVKTLSGGQTFQAALCLALALADNIQKITESNQNFFFLDEGFGSLDKDSLSVVFDTLKSLRNENRIVGVISHVEEMQQEIDTHLRIVNHEETGSKILNSWTL